ncbi:glycosyltransferase [Enterococcus casseliflavus]|uniref:glycosyltransferase n=2 Tax=Enterococcus casseliflavus TaxID=37734 RepID=UPI0022E19FCF|nr:glycosyltransferase [Enterococcus casseliflavus]
MYNVTVIMSTYNGERFIEEQIESIFAQVNCKVTLFIRDDNSTDNTLFIVNKLKNKYPIEIITDQKNLGPAVSFLTALRKCSNKTEFYAYADQDDVWYSDKLNNACSKLSLFSQEDPSLYCSTYDVVDENLDVLFTRNLNEYGQITMEKTLMGVSPSGCTMVFNQSLKEIIDRSTPNYMRMHDFWTLLTLQAYSGNLVIDNEPTMAYRQHGNNTVGFSNKFEIKHWKRLFLSIKNNNERLKQAQSVWENYKDILDEKNKISILKLLKYKTSLKSKFDLILDDTYDSCIPRINILFKISILMGIF